MAWPTLARTAGRLRGSRYRDDLARLASRSRFDADGLIAHARTGHVGVAADFDPKGLAWFGHLIASEHETGTNVEDTVALFRLAYRIGGHRVLSKDLNGVWVQALSLAGEFDKFRSVLTPDRVNPSVLWAADTDALHPGTVGPGATAWLGELNRPFRDAGLEPLDFREGDEPPFDRVVSRASGPAVVDDGAPLVSVVVPVYNPDASLRTAVDSLLAQTWPHLEILLCDDASDHGAEIFEELVALDPRIRHVRADRNGGAYRARNMGIGLATGELVTFNDADDWSHPRRIERQFRAMQADPEARACMSWSIRTMPDMRLTVLGRPPERVNLSSILFRRSDVLTAMGGFDAVRKAADSEFVERFRTRFGEGALLEIEVPLALVQLTEGSLSRDDFRFLRTNPARRQYMADFRHWHARLASDPEAAYVNPGLRPPFPAPAYLEGRQPTSAIDLDVLIMANLTSQAPTVVDLATEVTALTEAGLRVGVAECLAPYDLTASVREARGPLADAIRRGVRRVLPGEQVETRLLVVRDPAGALAMPDQLFPGVRAERALLVADYSPNAGGGYQPADAATMLAEHTGAATVWLPATDAIADALAARDPDAMILPPVVLGALPDAGLSRVPPAASPPTVGIVLDSTLPPPGVLELLRKSAAEFDCRLLTWGARRTNGEEIGRVEHLRTPSVSDDEFARLADIIIVPAVPHRGPHLPAWLAHALHLGKVVLLPTEFRQHFDNAALYLDAMDLSGLLGAWEGPNIEAQQQLAVNWAASRLTADAVRSAILPLLMTSKENVNA